MVKLFAPSDETEALVNLSLSCGAGLLASLGLGSPSASMTDDGGYGGSLLSLYNFLFSPNRYDISELFFCEIVAVYCSNKLRRWSFEVM